MALAQENYDGINTSYNEGVADLTELLDSKFARDMAIELLKCFVTI